MSLSMKSLSISSTSWTKLIPKYSIKGVFKPGWILSMIALSDYAAVSLL